MTERFAWLVERLYRANLRMGRCGTEEERQRARAWLQVWNRALRCEHERENATKNSTPKQDPSHSSSPERVNG